MHPAKRAVSQPSAPLPAKLPRVADATDSSSSRTSGMRPTRPTTTKRQKAPVRPHRQPRRILDGPYHSEAYIERIHRTAPIPLKDIHKLHPKVPLNNVSMTALGSVPNYDSVQGTVIDGDQRIEVWRTTAVVNITPTVAGIGDHPEKKQSIHLAALSALYQIQELGLLDDPKKLQPPKADVTSVILSNGTAVNYDKARSFMDWYCRHFRFASPDIEFISQRNVWEAVMTVGDRRIGVGTSTSKKGAKVACFLDVAQYLEQCDPQLWTDYLAAAHSGADLPMAPKVQLNVSPLLEDTIADLCDDIRSMSLFRNRPSRHAVNADTTPVPQGRPPPTGPRSLRSNPTGPRSLRSPAGLAEKSKKMQEQRNQYLKDPAMAKMRLSRSSLPVFNHTDQLLTHIANNEITIVMAATGSGKTTQIPQILLDDFIDRGEGSNCNIICTQPRRLAAISVADRVAKERGEKIGSTIGYQVRFEASLPELHGSVTFCTTGIFLKRLQSALAPAQSDHGGMDMDHVSHIVVDEVHERDVDTDLLLVVLKQWMALKKSKGQALKVVLMSATIDPTLFQKYFPDESGRPADVINIPGRSFPVDKHFMDTYIKDVVNKFPWLRRDELVGRYIKKELGPAAPDQLGFRVMDSRDSELDIPYPLIVATIIHVLQSSSDGHVLVFLPGWQEISTAQKGLLNPQQPLPINFNDKSQYALHILHSSIPLAEQQAIFEPPPPGQRRVILATNIAETSVTIPDVVYVIDSARVKEQRYEPERHVSSLISAWVGSSNLHQRAGRAGRHRSGEYFGLLSKAHADQLHPHQTVEMKRVDLSNVVMHVKALNFPGMTVEEVLAAAIEPPDPERVAAAMNDLKMVGALDEQKNLTSLGRVLLQLPVDVQVGRLVLYGSFFRCLEEALTLAAILTNRDPFVSPMHIKQEAAQKKNSWSPEEARSDALATLRAYNAWWALQSRGEYVSANRFCVDNFLAKPTLLMIQKIRVHLLQALYRAGVIEISAGGEVESRRAFSRDISVPPALNVNSGSMPLLSALIAIASQPKFAIRTGEKTYRTPTDKIAFIHPSSVNNRKRETPASEVGGPVISKQLYAFAEKRRNDTVGSPQTNLLTTTRLDPMTYVLFGAYHVEVVERGLECDNWLPIVGDVRMLDDVQRLKTYIEGSMLRVFEGIVMSRQRRGQQLSVLPREMEQESEGEDELEYDGRKDYTLSHEEMQDLDDMTRRLVQILNQYSDERLSTRSGQTSRAATPVSSPFMRSSRLALDIAGSPVWKNSRLPREGQVHGSPFSRIARLPSEGASGASPLSQPSQLPPDDEEVKMQVDKKDRPIPTGPRLKTNNLPPLAGPPLPTGPRADRIQPKHPFPPTDPLPPAAPRAFVRSTSRLNGNPSNFPSPIARGFSQSRPETPSRLGRW